MAVTLTRARLASRLRVGREQEELNEVDNLLGYVTEAVTKLAPNAPDAVHNTAAWMLAGYLYDRPFAGSGDRYANAMRNSGAASVLLPYRVHRAGSIGRGEPELAEDTETMLIQQTPFQVTATAQDLAASYGPGRYRADIGLQDAGVLYAYGPQPPADDSGYFVLAYTGERSFDFTSPGPVWVKLVIARIPQTLAVARYP